MAALANLYEAAGEIRALLMPFAFLLCVIGIGEMGWRAGSDARAILGALLKTVLIVGLLAAYPTMMERGQEAFIDIRNQFTNARDAEFVKMLRSRIENQPSDSLTDLGKIVPAAIGYFFQGIGRFMLILLRFFQEFAIAGLVAVSPLLIGFLFVSYTQSLGIQFAITSLTVLLWHLAICLVDIVIQAVSDVLFGPITAGAVSLTGPNLLTVSNWLLFPFVMAFAAFVTVFFYLAVPFVASAVMRGLSGTTSALQAGVQGGLSAAGVAVGTGLTAAGAAATLGGSAAAQGALEGTKAAAGTAAATGRISSNVLGGMSSGSSPGGSGGSDVPQPPPIPPMPDANGDVANPQQPSMVARQTSPDGFTVTDSSAGTQSQHPGQVTSAYAAQSAFNSHEAKARNKTPANTA